LLELSKKYILNPYKKAKLKPTDFPPQIWIENTNYCNANCVMCPRDKMSRNTGFMDYSLYEKLIKEISSYNIERLHLHNFGEPLLDTDLPKRIKLAKEYGINHTYIVTNGSLLTSEMARAIIGAGLDEFKISFYGTDSETYSKTMKGLKFERVIQNINEFFKIRSEMGCTKPNLIIQYLPQETNKAKTQEFINIFDSKIDKVGGDQLLVCGLHNFGGGKEYNPLGKTFMTCKFPWETMVILYDGKVSTCCIDYDGRQIVDDVTDKTIKEIWNGSQMNKIRKDFWNLKYEDYPVCMNCDVIR